MPNGEIQKEFLDTLDAVGKWTKQFGYTIYGTRGGPLKPEKWLVSTQNEKQVFVHILSQPPTSNIFIPGQYKNQPMMNVSTGLNIAYQVVDGGVQVSIVNLDFDKADNIILLEKK